MTARAEAPAPLRRRGPRPLLFHLMLAMLRSVASNGASPSSNAASPASNEALAALRDRIAAALAQAGPGAEAGAETAEGGFARAILAETLRQDRALVAGIAAYRRHPWQRDLPDPPAIWEEGGSRLLDYAPGAPGPVVLFVPSLVNRAHVLDLMPGRSMLRWLAGQGIRPLLLDWGWPNAVERGFTLTDYIVGRLERALAAAPAGLVLAGYCMGGLLALAAALRRPDRVRALALLATPWDFHAPEPGRAIALGQALPLLEPALAFNQTLPVDVLQMMFACLDPFGVAAKYRSFARLDPGSERAALFVALEDWLNDGIPLAAPVARACLRDWYGANDPARGAWRVAGLPVEPAAFDRPAFVAVPGKDRIVPPESALPLAGLIPDAVLHQPKAGHIGMVAGGTAEATLWRPLAEWVLAL
ncbi:MAG TPA: alpha/beta fold hydrolase [Acetobacteraceae bacterium]|nr:alpha/beta fold hydrolase [Acetobacteraceae bacterium]